MNDAVTLLYENDHWLVLFANHIQLIISKELTTEPSQLTPNLKHNKGEVPNINQEHFRATEYAALALYHSRRGSTPRQGTGRK
jgi:hypothetical protein